MSLYDDIQKVRKIPETDENVVFIRREDSDTVKRNPKLKIVRRPRNENLYDFDISSSQSYDLPSHSQNALPQEYILQENEIASSIIVANCGINYSNEKLEEHWKMRQKEASLSSKDTSFKKDVQSDNCDDKNLITEVSGNTKIEDKDNIENIESILKKCRLNKNAVVRGLLNSQKISINDLYLPNDSTDIKKDNMPDANVPSISQENYTRLVQCPEASEVFVPFLQVGPIPEDKNIDFTVPHIGKKKATTPRQFYVNMNDSEFNFVKTNSVKKKKPFNKNK
ncbi:hypothetical protein K0M31_003560 [Melipona bicolor]|uniref:Uncharacterized protein n=1 Tax=Melipona bicolor TaxID=60889 RepID=A0AA40FZV7_9HYME|nr:hypothetical protein K0M31_003560 [Melipona bicolor]